MTFLCPSRRQMISLGSAFALIGGRTPAGASGLVASGHVFEDRTGSGRFEAGNPGVPDVLVSNGRAVARTDRAGRWALPIEDDCVIFLIKPRGWSVPLDPATRLPKFYYIHQPGGSPEALGLADMGLAPTGPLPASIDFALTRAVEPTAFDVLMFADPQPANVREIAYIRDTVTSALAGSDAAFGLTLGDVMSDDLSLYGHLARVIGAIGLPWWNLPGNHDINYAAVENRHARETWKANFGPPCYAFEYGSAVFLMLDNVNWSRRDKISRYEGRIGQAQLEFIENVLSQVADDRLIVVCMHVPLRSAADPLDPASNTADAAALLKLLGDRPAVSFSGHMHTTEHHYLGAEAGCEAAEPHHHHVLTAVSGSWWSGPMDSRGIPVAQSVDGTPNGWHVLSIRGTTYTTRFVSAREPTQMRLLLQTAEPDPRAEGCMRLTGDIPIASVCRSAIVANVFDAGPRSKVTCELAGQTITLSRDRRADPFTRDLFERAGASLKPWVRVEPSSHLWSASLPTNLAAGVHCAVVRVENEYGQIHAANLVFEVSEG